MFDVHAVTALKIFKQRRSSAGISASGIMFGPSLNARSGFGWVSMNRPLAPAASAARASTGANSRWPDDLSPPPPGSCTECVASKTTGQSETPHRWNRAHVGHEVVVPERRAALREQEFFRARAPGLFHDLAHFRRRKELAFFQVHDLARGHGGFNQIRLAAEESGNLQNVHDFARDGGVRFVMNVGQDRHADFLAHFGQHAQTFVEARPAKGFGRSAVGLVEAGLEDVKDAECAQVFFSAAATCRHSFSFSITHGPAIRNNRRGELRAFQMAASLSTRKF